jgi:hypothetical protein
MYGGHLLAVVEPPYFRTANYGFGRALTTKLSRTLRMVHESTTVGWCTMVNCHVPSMAMTVAEAHCWSSAVLRHSSFLL